MHRLALFVVFYLILPFPSSAVAEWSWIKKTQSKTLIVFVHGFRGEPKASFAAEGRPSWPELMTTDDEQIRGAPSLSSYSVALIGYPTGRADRLNIQEIGYRLLVELDDSAVLDNYSDVIFVTHSLGGLVVKELLTTAAKDNHTVLAKVAAVFLIAVPSKGAPAAEWAQKLLSEAIVEDMKPVEVNAYLQNLDGDWERLLRKRQNNRPRVFCAYERQKTLTITVVPIVYVSTFCDERPWAENKDHFSIVKPESKADSIYGWVRGRIASLDRLGTPTKQPPEPAPSTTAKGTPENVEPKPHTPEKQASASPEVGTSSGKRSALPGTRGSGWVARQGFTTCSEVRSSCERDPNKLHPSVCSNRYQSCLGNGCWRTNTQGSVCGLLRS